VKGVKRETCAPTEAEAARVKETAGNQRELVVFGLPEKERVKSSKTSV